jgi:hypothetical protein
MGSHFLDTIFGAIRRRLEQWQYSLKDLGIRDRANDNPVMVITCTAVSAVLLVSALVWSRKSNSVNPFEAGGKAWFYDQNAEQLFTVSSKKPGPIGAPSGPMPNGSPAGVRAHVYSHIPEPNESDLFIGFLEMPATRTDRTEPVPLEMDSAQLWGRNRMIKRPEDKTWVPANSREGRKILSDLSRPNARGQTPIYHKAP